MQSDIFIAHAFIANGKGGNPAGVVLDAEGLQPADMLAVAQKVGMPETAFVSASNAADYKICFFTPTGEVDLCGHATIAAWSLLHQRGISKGTYTQQTRAGALRVKIEEDGLIWMEQAVSHLFEEVNKSEIISSLNINPDQFHERLSPQVVSTGLRGMLVPLKGKEVLNVLQPNIKEIMKLSRKYGVTGLHVFALLDGGPLAAARNLSPLVGIPEEAASGTANGALLAYLREHDALAERSEYRIEQGEIMGNLSYIYGKFENGTVWIGGYTSSGIAFSD